MKKGLALGIAILAISVIVKAQLLSDDFNYSGALTANGWNTHSGAGTNPVSTTTGLTYAGLQGSGIGNAALVNNLGGEDVNKIFTTQNTNGQSIYFSALINVTDAATKTGDYLLHIGNATAPTTFTAFAARVFVRTTATGVNFGINNTSTATWGTTEFARNTVYLLIVKYTINTGGNDDVSLWIKSAGVPATEAAAGTAELSLSTGAGQDIINAVALRQGTTNSPQSVVDALKVGLTWAEVTPGGAPAASLSASPLTAFGNVCINTTAGPNSFTITGTNLTTANVDVAPLAGYTYSTTSGGTYTTSLSLTQAGGPFSQQVFVKFDPTLVQSYNGNIVVSGGGAAASVNVAASGAGINSAPTVTSGSASVITQNGATVAGTISANGCTAITAYGIEWSTSSGFANGTGTAVPASNLAAGSFSSNLSGLSSGTTYYYHAYATNAGGTAYGAELSFTTSSPNPTISATALTAFGNICTNTTAGPNSFTITGTNLLSTNVVVDPLAGFTYSTTAGGTYTTSLSIPQGGGAFSQEVFVKFTPTAVQSYNGNIVVGGGGASSVNVAASGAGVNTAPTVTSGSASAITQTTATVAGTITATGCTAVTAYGIEWSTTNGFANGSGTQVASTNSTGGNFSSALTLLTPSTTYYYKAYATNSGGTSYGAQQSFTTTSPPPPSLNGTALTGFGNVCINTTTAANSFTINGTNLTTANIVVGPLTGFTFSETAGGTYVTTLTITQSGGTQAKTVYVKFSPTAVQSYNGNIPVTGGGATGTLNIAATGAGVNTTPTVATGGASNIFTYTANLAGSITSNGCSNVTAYGIEISGVNGFADGTGTKVAANNLSGNLFGVTVNNLVQGATYYYKAYATNSGGTSYGAQQSFTVVAVPDAFTVFPVPVAPGAELRFSIKNIPAGNYSLQFFGSNGALAFQYNVHVQSNYINQAFNVPGTMARGVYQLHLVNTNGVVAKQTILVH